MCNKQTFFFSFSFCYLLALTCALPAHVPSYKLPKLTNSTDYDNSLISTTDRLGVPQPKTQLTTPLPQFEYALLGQDPKDQRWYRVSLTPTAGKSGFRAQIATRQSPPYDNQLAHKHDKTIAELLKFLDSSEEQNLLKVYRELLASEQYNAQNLKLKRNAQNEIEVITDWDGNDSKTDGNHSLLLIDESSTPTPTANQSNSDNKMVKNFVYFIKGLK
ncbi:CG16956 [Drosophila busckii]|uniref:CG16956 n=1 Tax=Drosophila busckii TaxID=30019 RepID=A0A0M4ECU8_DROBS|nr:CG16956 [Drosophila busckii]